MSEFTNIMKIKKRLCKSMKDTNGFNKCEECVLFDDLEFKACCNSFMLHEPERAEKILLEWDKDHPIITNTDKLKEIFGDDFELTLNKVFCVGCACIKCPEDQHGECGKCKYNNFWKREYVLPTEVKNE